MLRILIVSVALALGLCGCSKNDDVERNKVTDSGTKAPDSANDAASETRNAATTAAQDTAGTVKEGADDMMQSAAKADQEAKEGIREATKKAGDETKDARWAAAIDWSAFQGMVNKCDTLTGAEKKQCIKDAKDTYRASNFNCETMGPQDKVQCRKYGEQWKIAGTDPAQANTTAVKTGEPNTIPADPGDPTDEARNRDSTKKQE